MKRKILTISITLLIALVFLILSFAFIPASSSQYKNMLDELASKFSPETAGHLLSERMKNSNGVIIAYINGEEIYKDDFEFWKHCAELSYITSQTDDMLSDDEILKQVAIQKLISIELKKSGIEYTKEQAIKDVKEKAEERYTKQTSEQREEDSIYYKTAGYTRDEYMEYVGYKLEIISRNNTEYANIYLEIEKQKKKETSTIILSLTPTI
ncbi:MAG: hypothetical protein PHY15_01970 [Eubacteriales bacterium]|nr:hypothetical protein [Eubacteriales bacterium]MDD4475615.1 hypothetical protein [Eubacteriales bacterium]